MHCRETRVIGANVGGVVGRAVLGQGRLDRSALLGHRLGEPATLAVVDFGDVEHAAGNSLGGKGGMRGGVGAGEIDRVIVMQQSPGFFDGQGDDAFLRALPRHEPRHRAGDGRQNDADRGDANSGALLEWIHRNHRCRLAYTLNWFTPLRI